MADLGSRTQTGVSDAVPQINPYLLGTGWDVIFDASTLSIPRTELEIWHIALDGPVGSFITWTRNGKPLGFAAGWTNEWDGRAALGQTDIIAFLWNFAFTAGPYNKTSNVLPTVTIWLREPTGMVGLGGSAVVE